VLGNLIENAFDAVDGQERREVVVSIRERKDGILLEVRDSGPGVPRALLSTIFESGFSTKSTNHVPRGFGLHLVKKLVVAEGGEVSVRNNNGAVFMVRLPRSAPAPAARDPERVVEATRT
jgi:CitB family two-component system sensor histidine kinase CitS